MVPQPPYRGACAPLTPPPMSGEGQTGIVGAAEEFRPNLFALPLFIACSAPVIQDANWQGKIVSQNILSPVPHRD